jgi:hypothetical protein
MEWLTYQVHKTFQKAVGKGLEAHPTSFSRQNLG